MKKKLSIFIKSSVYLQLFLLFLSVLAISFANGEEGDSADLPTTTATGVASTQALGEGPAPNIVVEKTTTISSSPVATHGGSTLSNWLDIGYSKDTYLYEGKYYKAGAKLTEGGNTITIGKNGAGEQVSGWQVAGGWQDALASGAQWAVIAYFAGTMIGDALGATEEQSQSLGYSLGAGFGAYKLMSVWEGGLEGGGFTSGAGIAGAAIGAAVFVATYKDVEITVVTFDCMPWQAPTGGNNCERCNDDTLPCSEYRCKSLGQSCELVNPGTEEEKCVYVNPGDVNPPIISPNYDDLSPGHQFKNVKNSPPGPGFEIINTESGDGCLQAFTALQFGLTTDEPAQCKIDYNHTASFDEMTAYLGGSNLYSYNHTEIFSLPNSKDLSGAGFVLENGKDLTFYIRCMDKNGNENTAEYAVNFCIDPSPDATAPKIEATSIENGGCVAENTQTADVIFYTNEPATCKWSFQDESYDSMDYNMTCSNSIYQSNAAQLFPCNAQLSGIPKDGTTFYIRCKDQPNKPNEDRNENRESYKFELRGSTGLIITEIKPNISVFSGVSPAPVELYVETLYGCDNGKAICHPPSA